MVEQGLVQLPHSKVSSRHACIGDKSIEHTKLCPGMNVRVDGCLSLNVALWRAED